MLPGVAAHDVRFTTADLTWVPHLKSALFAGGPCPYGIKVVSEFYGYSSGIFDSGCGSQANHAVVVLGWGMSNSVLYWESLNSWGPSFGNNGHFNVASCVITDYTILGDITADVPAYYSR